MSNESLCIRTFAGVLRGRMNRKSQIKKFDSEKKWFQSDAEIQNSISIDLSGVFNFYKLLLDAVVYMAISEDEGEIPDISSTMTTQLKNGKWEIHEKIKEIAQGNNMKAVVADYFEANLIPNIPNTVLTSVLDDVDNLVRNSADVRKKKRDALKQAYQQKKSDANYLAEVYLVAICNGTNKIDNADSTTTSKNKKIKDPFEALDELEASINKLPVPIQKAPPKHILQEEQPYISELYAAYGDKEGVKDFCEKHLAQYAEYNEDRDDRRIDYFAADSIRQGIRELYLDEYTNQFTVLKEETWAGIRNTARKSYPNGYEKMLSVMEQAAIIQVAQYTLSRSPNWISNRIKMGVCHFLVNDNILKWVKR